MSKDLKVALALLTLIGVGMIVLAVINQVLAPGLTGVGFLLLSYIHFQHPAMAIKRPPQRR